MKNQTIKSIILFLILLLLSSCTIWESKEQIYIIEQGQHYCTRPMTVDLAKHTVIDIEVLFTQSCIYDLKNDNQADWNKLIGIGFIPHQENSFRFGWRWNTVTKLFEIGAFVHNKGKILPELVITTVAPNQWIKLNCTINYNLKQYEVMGYVIPFTHDKVTSYKLYPYFGGDEVAPHTMIIKTKQ